MRKKFVLLLSCVLFLTLSAPLAARALPYRSYTYDGWDEAVPSQAGYAPTKIFAGADFGGGIESLRTPRDFCVAGERIFILDSGNNRVLILDSHFKIQSILTEFVSGEETLTLNSPAGLFVDGSGLIYIADTGNEQVMVTDEKGSVLRLLRKPKTDLLDKALEFKPQKVLADSMGNIYVAVTGVYQGALLYKPDGTFDGFFGSNTVEVTASLLLDRLWKNLLTASQADNISRYVPEEITAFDIDDRDFVYTVTQSAGVAKKLKKLNPLGEDILTRAQGEVPEFGEQEQLYIAGVSTSSRFADVCVNSDGNIAVLDLQNNRIFEYDREGRLLFIFGGKGVQRGTFQSPVAIDTLGNDLLVLDSQKANITVYSPTKFGAQVHKAVRDYNDGQYARSVELWQEILKQDHNYTIGYVSIGKALLADNRYREAAEYFQLGNDRQGNSEAFSSYRNRVIQKFFPLVCVLIVALIGLIVWRFGKKRGPDRNPDISGKISPLRFLFHPIDNAEEMKRKNAGSMLYAVIILAVWAVSTILEYSLTGFRFNLNNPDNMNVFLLVLKTVPLFLVWVCANWGVTTLMNGKGRMKDIFISNAYCLIPFVAATLINIPLSHLLALPESIFLSWIMGAGLLWSGFLFLGVLSGIHEYTFTQTIVSTFLTIVGVLIVIFLILLVGSLLQQAYLFLYSIINELLYRY